MAKLVLHIGHRAILGGVGHNWATNSWTELLANVESILDDSSSIRLLISDDCIGLGSTGSLSIGVSSFSDVLKFPLIATNCIGVVNSSV